MAPGLAAVDRLWTGAEAGPGANVAQAREVVQESHFWWVPIGTDRDHAQSEIPKQSKVFSLNIMESRFGAYPHHDLLCPTLVGKCAPYGRRNGRASTAPVRL